VLLEGAAEPGRAVAEQRLVGVIGRNRGLEVRVDHPALHRVQAPVAEVIAQPVGVQEIVGSAEAGGPEHLLVAGALMTEVVDGVADLLVRHNLAVLLGQQDRYQAGLPVVAADDVGALAGPGHELERRRGEEREPLRVVGVPVQAVPVKEPGGRLDSHLGGTCTLTLPGRIGPATRESAWKKSASGSLPDGRAFR
jgi:hypothetical protein